DHGAMAALAMPEERVRPLLPDGVGVACLNAPGATVVSGGTAAVDRVVRELDGLRLPVAHAFHSPLVAGAVADLRKALDAAEVTAPRRPVYSTVTGELLAPGTDLREHLVRQTTAPVLFDRAMEAAAGTDLWIEAGPDTVLTPLARGRGVPAFAVEAGSEGIGGLLRCAAAAWALGRDVRVEALYEHRFLRPIDPGRPQRFLANPCERAAPAAAPEPERRPAPVPAPGATVEEAAGAAPADVIRAVVAERAELPRVREERDHYHAEVQDLRRDVARLDRPWLDPEDEEEHDAPLAPRTRRRLPRVLVPVLLVAFLATGLAAGARLDLGALDLLALLGDGIASLFG
ncbi:acyltransferase domain-containing protein, partial [Nocardiopsis tropica]|nr:acyltransferase domain-containing protein [Nocardiopsis tropica]